MIDLHSHILPGVDDGARSLEGSVEIGRAAAADGVRTIAATPHVRHDYPTDADTMERLVGEVRAALRAAGVELEVLCGGEIALDFLPRLDDAELRRFALGGSNVLLLEFSYYGWPLELEQIVFSLRTRGFRPVLAHPERNKDVQENPERLRRAVDGGALVQLTAASVDGRLGRTARASAAQLLELELAHLIASDAHAPAVREAGMRAAAEAAGGGELGAWLTESVPRALLDGAPLPPRPVGAKRRSLLPWRS